MLQTKRVIKKPPIPTQIQHSAMSRLQHNSSKQRSRASSVGTENNSKIQVVLRCKGKPTSESSAPIPTILEHIEPSDKHAIHNSTAKDVLLNTNNTIYSFDCVFREKSTQEDVYSKIAAPILEDVIKGFSCTIFAYGQTGTGKTYTMEGDLGETLTGGYGNNAGIIPRIIYNLFDDTGLRTKKHHIMVSMLELYNEDLRDLLCASDEQKPLNIFEEKDGTGIKVQNIQEQLISSASQGLEIMKAGVKKRMTASTKCNKKSSRSHCIFTITIYMQEKTPEGLDVFKVGKLNLVDLAGSENSKSAGSVNVRAREAASINKSLLTLGRVINCLVDKTPHIPYRESKLTRLLKDSLGGRTKTCIIATVSPAQQNQEEIRNTLDYASHAKGICNKPQRNHHINHERRVDSLLQTIDQLQEELRVNYEKHGVYQTKKQYDAKEQELQQLRDNNGNLQTTNNQLLQTQQEIKEREDRRMSAAMSRVRESEDALSLVKKEKEKLVIEHDIDLSKIRRHFTTELEKLKREFATKEKVLTEESKQKEDDLKQELERKELVMRENDRVNQQKHRESIESIKHFLNGSFTDIDAKLSCFMTDMAANDAKDEIIVETTQSPAPARKRPGKRERQETEDTSARPTSKMRI